MIEVIIQLLGFTDYSLVISEPRSQRATYRPFWRSHALSLIQRGSHHFDGSRPAWLAACADSPGTGRRLRRSHAARRWLEPGLVALRAPPRPPGREHRRTRHPLPDHHHRAGGPLELPRA